MVVFTSLSFSTGLGHLDVPLQRDPHRRVLRGPTSRCCIHKRHSLRMRQRGQRRGVSQGVGLHLLAVTLVKVLGRGLASVQAGRSVAIVPWWSC